MLFSERMGITPPKNVVQLTSMDSDLRNGLWNSFYDSYIDKIHVHFHLAIMVDSSNTDEKYGDAIAIARLFRSLWVDFFKKAYDEIRYKDWSDVLGQVRLAFFDFEWYEVYNFLDFIVCNYSHPYDFERNNIFITATNKVLERELSGYRFVGNKLALITSQDEISSIENALEDTIYLQPINTHLKTSLELFADRRSPDYRNSIKESISAVEAICGLIAGKTSTLGKALEEIERKSKIQIHSALKKSFDNLYGYTSNADGIRHALLEDPNLASEDAKFMLVSCSAFINYLITKASKAGIDL